MAPQEISDLITNCLEKGMEHRTNKEHIEAALEELIPVLGNLPAMKRKAEYDYAVAYSAGVATSNGSEKIRLVLGAGVASKEKADLEEIKRLEKSLDMAISALQTLYREL